MTTHVSTYCTSNNYNMVYTFLQLLHSLYNNNKYIDFYKAHKMPINLKNVVPKYLTYGWNLGWLIFPSYFMCGNK